MKKLILLLALALVMCGCVPHTPYSIVIKVKKAELRWYSHKYKYSVKTNNNLRFYTNEQLNVGDTIQITKKNLSVKSRNNDKGRN